MYVYIFVLIVGDDMFEVVFQHRGSLSMMGN